MNTLAEAGAKLIGGVLRRTEALSGGSLSQIVRIVLADGREAIVKNGALINQKSHTGTAQNVVVLANSHNQVVNLGGTINLPALSASADKPGVIQVFKKVELLGRFPERGRVVPETHRRDIREILFPPYRLIYRLRNTHVAMLTARHSKQRFSYTEVL